MLLFFKGKSNTDIFFGFPARRKKMLTKAPDCSELEPDD